MTNSRAKGVRGELEFARLLTSEGFPARRGQQFKGGPESPDVICESLPVHWEVKRTERLNVYDALEQAVNESPRDTTGYPSGLPIVAHRRSQRDWVAILKLSDLLDILRESDLVASPTSGGDGHEFRAGHLPSVCPGCLETLTVGHECNGEEQSHGKG